MNYSGIDLHSNNSVVSVIDETDRVVAEKRLPNDLARILAFLAPWRAGLAGVVVESTYNWYWLVDGLQAAGFVVHLANTTAIKKCDGLKQSGDETDACYLAHLLRLCILPAGTILPTKHREVRDLARKRMDSKSNILDNQQCRSRRVNAHKAMPIGRQVDRAEAATETQRNLGHPDPPAARSENA